MSKRSINYFRLSLVGLDSIALLGSFTAAYILRISLDPRPFHTPISAVEFISSIAALLPCWLILFYFLGLYDRNVYTHPIRNFGRLLLAAASGIMLMISFSFFTNIPLFPAKLVAVYGLFISFAILFTLRSGANLVRLQLLRHGIGMRRVALVGSNQTTHDLATFLHGHPEAGFCVEAIIAAPEHIPAELQEKRQPSLSAAARRDTLDAVIQTDNVRPGAHYQVAAQHFLDFYQAPVLDGLLTAQRSVEVINSTPLVYIHPTPLMGPGRIAKRAMDIVGGTIGLIFASPIMLLVALAVKLGDPKGPVFMRGVQQVRLTRYNIPFRVYKFRSHYAKFDGKTDEEVFQMIGKPELIKEYRQNGDKLDHDFRVTPVGRFIRRFSLDELPQLLNVVKGDISLVGPRALVPRELDTYDKRHMLLTVKSGLTGLAVVSGRRSISFEERRRLDLYYVQNWSLWLDITILLKTVLVVFQKES